MRPAVELSYLTPDEQQMVYAMYDSDEITPSYSQAQRMRKLSEERELNQDKLFEILSVPKPNQKPMLKLSVERLRSIAPKVTEAELENFVIKACDYYYRHLMKVRGRDSR